MEKDQTERVIRALVDPEAQGVGKYDERSKFVDLGNGVTVDLDILIAVLARQNYGVHGILSRIVRYRQAQEAYREGRDPMIVILAELLKRYI